MNFRFLSFKSKAVLGKVELLSVLLPVSVADIDGGGDVDDHRHKQNADDNDEDDNDDDDDLVYTNLCMVDSGTSSNGL